MWSPLPTRGEGEGEGTAEWGGRGKGVWSPLPTRGEGEGEGTVGGARGVVRGAHGRARQRTLRCGTTRGRGCERGDTTPQVARHRFGAGRRRLHAEILGSVGAGCQSGDRTAWRIDTRRVALIERALRVDAENRTSGLARTALCILLQGRRLSLDNSIPAMPRIDRTRCASGRRHRGITDHPALGESAKPKTTAPQGG